MKKKFFTCMPRLILSLIICIGMLLPINVNASEFVPETYNEYELIMEKINSIKKNRSVNSSELETAIKELEMLKKHIYSMKEWSIDQLKSANYTETQIENIRTYDGSNEKTSRAAASISRTKARFEIKRYDSSKKRTKAKVYLTYTMNGVPSPNLNAAIAVGLNDGGIWFDSGSGNMVVKYQSYYNNSYHYVEYDHTGVAASQSTGARVFNYNLHKTINNYAYYANTITINFEASRQGNIQVVTCVNKFTRETFGASGSIGLSLSGLSMSFTGSKRTEEINFSAFQS